MEFEGPRSRECQILQWSRSSRVYNLNTVYWIGILLGLQILKRCLVVALDIELGALNESTALPKLVVEMPMRVAHFRVYTEPPSGLRPSSRFRMITQ